MEERGGRGGIEGERRMEGRAGEAAQESAAAVSEGSRDN